MTFRVTDRADIRLQPDLGGGSLMDVGCYCVNVTRMVTAQEPIEVEAYASWGATGVDEQLVGSLRFENGLLAQFECSLVLNRRELYQLIGTEGVFDVPAAFLPGTSDTIIRQQRGRNEMLHQVPGADEYRLMVEHFSSCVLNDEPPRYPPTDAAKHFTD